MKNFDAAALARIGQAISRIESQSRSELVVMVKQRAGVYSEYPLAAGTILAFLSLTYFRFAPSYFDEWLIYAGTLSAFILGAVGVGASPALTRLAAGRKRTEKSVEIMARACFQKGGMHHTASKTGVLIFVALLERRVLLIPDRGVESAIPPVEWVEAQEAFDEIFRSKNPEDALIGKLDELGMLFSRYLPPSGVNLNELPDNMEVDL